MLSDMGVIDRHDPAKTHQHESANSPKFRGRSSLELQVWIT